MKFFFDIYRPDFAENIITGPTETQWGILRLDQAHFEKKVTIYFLKDIDPITPKLS